MMTDSATVFECIETIIREIKSKNKGAAKTIIKQSLAYYENLLKNMN